MRPALPSLKALRVFEAVARLGGFKDAAAELNVTPSAVSHQIKQLEAELGCRLMRRGRGGFELTRPGKRLSATTGRAFDAIAQVADDLNPGGAATLTVQVYSTFAVRWLLPRLAGFEAIARAGAFRLVTAQTDADLSDSDVDASVVIASAPDDGHIAHQYLFSSRVFPVASPDYLANAGPLRRPEDLANHPVLQVYPSEDDWRVWLHSAGMGDLDHHSERQFDSYDHALRAAARGYGVALAIEPFADDDLASGRLCEVFPKMRAALPRHWYFACLTSRADLPNIVTFRDWLLAQVEADERLWRPLARSGVGDAGHAEPAAP